MDLSFLSSRGHEEIKKYYRGNRLLVKVTEGCDPIILAPAVMLFPRAC